jgi:hypothetical protein
MCAPGDQEKSRRNHRGPRWIERQRQAMRQIEVGELM